MPWYRRSHRAMIWSSAITASSAACWDTMTLRLRPLPPLPDRPRGIYLEEAKGIVLDATDVCTVMAEIASEFFDRADPRASLREALLGLLHSWSRRPTLTFHQLHGQAA